MPEASIKEIMSAPVASVDANASVQEATKQMFDKGYNSILIKKDDDFVGIATDTDLMFEILIGGNDPASTKVSSIMSKDIISIAWNQPLREAITLMRDHKIKHIPVTKGDRIVGMLSIKDLITYYQKKHKEEASFTI